jgi:hypothetical protein
MNSRNKGKVGEREFAALLRANGFEARRGQQFSGSPESPDVICEALPWLHFEVKRCERVDLRGWIAQAAGDSAGKFWAVELRWNNGPWLTVILSEFFFELVRKFQPQSRGDAEILKSGNTSSGLQPPSPQCGEGRLPDRAGEGEDGAHGVTRPTTTISHQQDAGAEEQHNGK